MITFILLKIPVIAIVASLMLIAPVILGTVNIREVKKTPLMVIYLYLIVYVIVEIVAWYYALNGLQNHFITNLASYLDVLFLGWYYYLILELTIFKKIVLCLVGLALIIIFWSHLATGRDFNRIDSFALSIENICIISMALLFFYQLLNTLEVQNLFTYSHFWIGIAILIYFSIVFFVEIYAEYVTFNKDESIIQYWQIKQYLTFIQRIFLAIGLWFSKTPQQLSSSLK